MSSLPLEILQMFGQTIAKVVPITIVLALLFSLLVLRAADHPRGADRASGARRRGGFQYPRRRRADRVLRQRTRSVVRIAALGSGRAVPDPVGLHAVLAAPDVPRRRILEVPRDPSFLRGTGLDLGGAVSSRQPV